jgi:hypothetical protein
MTSWRATYSSQGKTATFRIELEKGKPTGTGRLMAEAGSDASVLLSHLSAALDANSVPSGIPRAIAISFVYVNLGDNLSQAPAVGFSTDPPGHWTALKLFLGEREREGEVFLNLNPVLGKGQFAIKDSDSGDLVMRELAKVL